MEASNEIDQESKDCFKIGCTFGATLYSNYTQPFYYCISCNEEIDDESKVICVICAIHCHKGHKLQIGAYGLSQKVFCDCGGGSFNNCENMNQKNSLSSVFK